MLVNLFHLLLLECMYFCYKLSSVCLNFIDVDKRILAIIKITRQRSDWKKINIKLILILTSLILFLFIIFYNEGANVY